MWRVLSLLGVCVVGSVAPWWLTIIAIMMYAFVYGGIELVIVAALLDGYFMLTFTPIFTVAAIIALLLALFVKPYTVFYNQ